MFGWQVVHFVRHRYSLTEVTNSFPPRRSGAGFVLWQCFPEHLHRRQAHRPQFSVPLGRHSAQDIDFAAHNPLVFRI